MSDNINNGQYLTQGFVKQTKPDVQSYVDFSSKQPIYTINILWFCSVRLTSTSYVTLFAAACLKIKLLIDICTVLCRILK